MKHDRTFSRSRHLDAGQLSFDAAVENLMSWKMHRRAGFRIRPDSPVKPGNKYTIIAGLGWLSLTAPVRIREVIDEATSNARRRGFIYETLPGHPEEGHESFVVEHDFLTDAVSFTVSAQSRPGRWWVTLGGPLARRAQDFATQRYLSAIAPTSRRSSITGKTS